jgi:hypothetical protein
MARLALDGLSEEDSEVIASILLRDDHAESANDRSNHRNETNRDENDRDSISDEQKSMLLALRLQQEEEDDAAVAAAEAAGTAAASSSQHHPRPETAATIRKRATAGNTGSSDRAVHSTSIANGAAGGCVDGSSSNENPIDTPCNINIVLIVVCVVLACAGILFTVGFQLGRERGIAREKAKAVDPARYQVGLTRVTALLDVCRSLDVTATTAAAPSPSVTQNPSTTMAVSDGNTTTTNTTAASVPTVTNSTATNTTAANVTTATNSTVTNITAANDATTNTAASSTINSTVWTVGVYYYPWYSPSRNGGEAFHGGKYLRKNLIPKQVPALGEAYDDTDPDVIAAHLCWSRYANVHVWMTSWWGPNHETDTTLRNVILPHKDLGDLQFAVLYESMGRTKANMSTTATTDSSTTDSTTTSTNSNPNNLTRVLDHAGPDVAHLCQYYFPHPNYFRIDGKPVVVFYLSRLFEREGLMRETATILRDAARNCGEQDIYLIGDHAFQNLSIPLDYLDAITNYDVYGATPRTNGYAYQSGIDAYFAMQRQFRAVASEQGVHYVPGVTPGFNNLGLFSDTPHPPLSRKLAPDLPLGSLFQESLRQARDIVDPFTKNLLLVTSWNEFHEDTVSIFCFVAKQFWGLTQVVHSLLVLLIVWKITCYSPNCFIFWLPLQQIEPVLLESSSSMPLELTDGLQYEGYAGYGNLYLDILQRLTRGGNSTVF